MFVVAAVILAWLVVVGPAAVLIGRAIHCADKCGSRVGSGNLFSEPTVELVPTGELVPAGESRIG
jgi:hypothetical protein